MIQAGKILQERYVIEKQIGQGGMGAVYVATDKRFGSKVAIKETLFNAEDFRRAFEREAQILNNMRHPALPRVSDYFSEDGKLFLVMEYIEGADLSEILKLNGAFEMNDVYRWADELL
ncbi:MAG: protein kinase, partial [Pyrinomonadaceae bacterium]|nr:protein kinase [Pyrinomonadaceae bacterium]